MDTLPLRPLLPPRRGEDLTSYPRPAAPDDGSGSDDGSIGERRREDWIEGCSRESAREVLETRPRGVMASRRFSVRSSGVNRKLAEKANEADAGKRFVVRPWNPYYRIWWHLTAVGAVVTVFLAPYRIAFEEDLPGNLGSLRDPGEVLGVILTLLFSVDILVNFNLAFYKDEEVLTFDRRQIAAEYLRGMFWVDVLGAFPFLDAALWVARYFGTDSERSFLVLSPLRLFRFARLHHLKKISDDLRYDAKVSLLSSTLFRNFFVVAITCHFEASAMYYLARLRDFDETTWLGPIVHDGETRSQRYINALYLSITTFCTVGYGDFSPSNPAEKIAGSSFMLVNIVIAAWIIGSVTMLLMKGDEDTRDYRQSLAALDQYGSMNNFDQELLNKLKEQLHLQFNNREIGDEKVLQQFPSAVRRKILRRLYKKHLVGTQLMSGVRPQFVDAFLTCCNIEIFSAGEEIVERGSILSDLFLLVGGLAEIAPQKNVDGSSHGSLLDLEHHGRPCVKRAHSPLMKLQAGDFIGEIGFFTESPQIDSIVSLTVCKTLTMPRSTWRLLAIEHPSSVGKLLQNLLRKVETASIRAQLSFDTNGGYQSLNNADLGTNFHQTHLTAVKELVEMHLRRNLDDQTTRLLFAASRGDTQTISVICNHGFNPNSTDYDHRTALMVASMKGNIDAVRLLLRYNASPNQIDVHGSSAMLEAVKCGHEDCMDLLSRYGANLSMSEGQAASYLCQAVYDGDAPLLKRLLKAGIDINAADYDDRTPAHVAAAEGNVAALRMFAEGGADLGLKDRWGNTVEDDARRANALSVLAFLEHWKEVRGPVHPDVPTQRDRPLTNASKSRHRRWKSDW